MSMTTRHPGTPSDPPPSPHAPARTEADAVAGALLSSLADLGPGADRDRVRARIIELYLPLAAYLARRFAGRGEPLEDLQQVANLALIKSVDGYDTDRGVHFPSYAIPMITGELKRHFRDKGWDIRVPRRLQELTLQIGKVTDELTHQLGRSPNVPELAAGLQVSEEDIIEALAGSRAYTASSLDAPLTHNGDDQQTLGATIGGLDPALAEIEHREALRPLLAQLSTREQRLIAMRFFGNQTQSQIAAELGISQMHVSRLLRQALDTLRTGLEQG
jgi:RNA polymerase sigma-B factor